MWTPTSGETAYERWQPWPVELVTADHVIVRASPSDGQPPRAVRRDQLYAHGHALYGWHDRDTRRLHVEIYHTTATVIKCRRDTDIMLRQAGMAPALARGVDYGASADEIEAALRAFDDWKPSCEWLEAQRAKREAAQERQPSHDLPSLVAE